MGDRRLKSALMDEARKLYMDMDIMAEEMNRLENALNAAEKKNALLEEENKQLEERILKMYREGQEKEVRTAELKFLRNFFAV